MRKKIKTKILTFIFLMTVGISSAGMGSFYVKAEEPDEITEEYIKLFEGIEDIETVDASKISIDNLSLVGSSYSVNAKASSYDPRKYGNRVTSVKDQNPYGLCWDYASNAAAESVLIKQGLATSSIDLSEIYFAYKEYLRQKADPNNTSNQGFVDFCNNGASHKSFSTKIEEGEYVGNFALESLYKTPATITDDYSLTVDQLNNYQYKVNRIYEFQSARDNINKIKEYIAALGGGYLAYSYAAIKGKYTIGDNCVNNDMNHYFPDNLGYNVYSFSSHAVELVGWDDNYPSSNFEINPQKNGAWLVKNSWGTDKTYATYDYIDGKFCYSTNNSGSGYMWISYYNPATVCFMDLAPKSSNKAYETRTLNYHYNDEIDLDSMTIEKAAKWKQIYENGNYTILNSSKVKFTSFNTYLYHAYDEYNNLIGKYTINVTAKDNADYSFEIDKRSFNKDYTEDNGTFNLLREATDFNKGYSDELFCSTSIDGVSINSRISSSNTDVAKIENGRIKVTGFGTAVITAAYSDSFITGGKAYTKSYKINVSEICSSVEWDESVSDYKDYKYIDLEKGDTYQISGVNTVPAGEKLTYESSDESLLTVTDDGVVTVVGYNKDSSSYTNPYITIRSTANPIRYTTLNVSITKCYDIYFDNYENYTYMTIGDTYQINAYTNTKRDTLHYSCSSSDVIEVSDTGLVTAKGLGSAEIRVTAESNSDCYNIFWVYVYEKTDGTIDTGSQPFIPENEVPSDNTYGVINDNTYYNFTNTDNANSNSNYKVKAVKKASVSSVKNKKSGKLQVKFYAKNAAKYHVEISTDKKFKKNSKTYVAKTNVITIKKLKKGKTYYVRVRGINSKGSGTWSKVKKIKIKK